MKNEAASVRYEQFVESLKPETLEAFRACQVKRPYSSTSVLYEAGEPSSGIFLIDEGKIKLSMMGSQNEPVHSRTAGRGEILGLCPTVSGKPHEVTAHAVGPSQVSFIPKDDFARLMYQDPEFAYRVLQYVCDDFGEAFEHSQKLTMGAGARGSRAR